METSSSSQQQNNAKITQIKIHDSQTLRKTDPGGKSEKLEEEKSLNTNIENVNQQRSNSPNGTPNIKEVDGVEGQNFRSTYG